VFSLLGGLSNIILRIGASYATDVRYISWDFGSYDNTAAATTSTS
jgi:hypothetical protein